MIKKWFQFNGIPVVGYTALTKTNIPHHKFDKQMEKQRHRSKIEKILGSGKQQYDRSASTSHNRTNASHQKHCKNVCVRPVSSKLRPPANPGQLAQCQQPEEPRYYQLKL